jgi:hypothetical protein
MDLDILILSGVKERGSGELELEEAYVSITNCYSSAKIWNH